MTMNNVILMEYFGNISPNIFKSTWFDFIFSLGKIFFDTSLYIDNINYFPWPLATGGVDPSNQWPELCKILRTES